METIKGSLYRETICTGVPKVSNLKEIGAPFMMDHISDVKERKVDYKLYEKIRVVSITDYSKNMHLVTSKFDKNLQFSNNLENLNRNILKS